MGDVGSAEVSQLVPKYRWDITKVASCMGQFLQVRASDVFGLVFGLVKAVAVVHLEHPKLTFA